MRGRCRQLVMIGDHLQLRQKAEYYPLRKEAGHGFDIDVSIFERLAKASKAAPSTPTAAAAEGVAGEVGSDDRLPLVTLKVQHRMRPEISRLVRETMYPGLVDHGSHCTLLVKRIEISLKNAQGHVLI